MAKKKQQNDSARGNKPNLSFGRLALGGLVLGAAALVGRTLRSRRRNLAEHPASDLALDTPRRMAENTATPPADQRAPEAFRPDPTAPVPEGERESLRPATAPKPTLVAGSDVKEGRAPSGT